MVPACMDQAAASNGMHAGDIIIAHFIGLRYVLRTSYLYNQGMKTTLLLKSYDIIQTYIEVTRQSSGKTALAVFFFALCGYACALNLMLGTFI